MSHTRSRFAALLVTGMLTALVIVACGSQDETVKPTVTRVDAIGAPATNAATESSGETAAVTTGPTEAAEGSGGADVDTASLVMKGSDYFTQFNCAGCHSVDGGGSFGPALNGLAGRTVKLSNGETITVDENYIRESILDPDAKTVDGYPANVMAASISGFQSDLSKEEVISALVAYLESLP
jgi:cytochrome c oxidase subunit 2